MSHAFALIAGSVLAAIGLLHVGWAFGVSPLSAAVIPTGPDGQAIMAPGRGITLGVAALLFTAAYLVLERGGVGPGLLSSRLAGIGCGGVALVLLGRGVGDFRYVGLFKRERGSAFARMDSRLYTPLVLSLGAMAAVVALRGS